VRTQQLTIYFTGSIFSLFLGATPIASYLHILHCLTVWGG
jgi:hypothetical protein